jgi:DNA-binding beta-propeller fold protein YncE
MKLSMVRQVAFVVCFLLLGAYAVAAPPPTSGYHLVKTIPLPASPDGKEYFDYITVDDAARRIYVGHGAEVQVLNLDDMSVVGTIPGFNRLHGIAIVSALGKGFITDGGAADVVTFDPKTLKVTGDPIKTYPDCDSIVYDPVSKLVFTFNGNSKNASVIDPVKGVVLKTLDMGGGPEFPVADGKGMIYDNNEETNEVVAIDTRTQTIKTRWPVAPAGQPTALTMDRQHRRLFSAGRNPQMVVMMDADNGKVIQSFPISGGVDAAIFEPATGMLFVSTRDGMIHTYHEDSPDKLSEVETVKTQYGAKTMGLDPKTHNLYVDTSDFNPPAAPTEKQPNPLPTAKPGNFRLLIYAPGGAKP